MVFQNKKAEKLKRSHDRSHGQDDGDDQMTTCDICHKVRIGLPKLVLNAGNSDFICCTR